MGKSTVRQCARRKFPPMVDLRFPPVLRGILLGKLGQQPGRRGAMVFLDSHPVIPLHGQTPTLTGRFNSTSQRICWAEISSFDGLHFGSKKPHPSRDGAGSGSQGFSQFAQALPTQTLRPPRNFHADAQRWRRGPAPCTCPGFQSVFQDSRDLRRRLPPRRGKGTPG